MTNIVSGSKLYAYTNNGYYIVATVKMVSSVVDCENRGCGSISATLQFASNFSSEEPVVIATVTPNKLNQSQIKFESLNFLSGLDDSDDEEFWRCIGDSIFFATPESAYSAYLRRQVKDQTDTLNELKQAYEAQCKKFQAEMDQLKNNLSNKEFLFQYGKRFGLLSEDITDSDCSLFTEETKGKLYAYVPVNYKLQEFIILNEVAISADTSDTTNSLEKSVFCSTSVLTVEGFDSYTNQKYRLICHKTSENIRIIDVQAQSKETSCCFNTSNIPGIHLEVMLQSTQMAAIAYMVTRNLKIHKKNLDDYKQKTEIEIKLQEQKLNLFKAAYNRYNSMKAL